MSYWESQTIADEQVDVLAVYEELQQQTRAELENARQEVVNATSQSQIEVTETEGPQPSIEDQISHADIVRFSDSLWPKIDGILETLKTNDTLSYMFENWNLSQEFVNMLISSGIMPINSADPKLKDRYYLLSFLMKNSIKWLELTDSGASDDPDKLYDNIKLEDKVIDIDQIVTEAWKLKAIHDKVLEFSNQSLPTQNNLINNSTKQIVLPRLDMSSREIRENADLFRANIFGPSLFAKLSELWTLGKWVLSNENILNIWDMVIANMSDDNIEKCIAETTKRVKEKINEQTNVNSQTYSTFVSNEQADGTTQTNTNTTDLTSVYYGWWTTWTWDSGSFEWYGDNTLAYNHQLTPMLNLVQNKIVDVISKMSQIKNRLWISEREMTVDDDGFIRFGFSWSEYYSISGDVQNLKDVWWEVIIYNADNHTLFVDLNNQNTTPSFQTQGNTAHLNVNPINMNIGIENIPSWPICFWPDKIPEHIVRAFPDKYPKETEMLVVFDLFKEAYSNNNIALAHKHFNELTYLDKSWSNISDSYIDHIAIAQMEEFQQFQKEYYDSNVDSSQMKSFLWIDGSAELNQSNFKNLIETINKYHSVVPSVDMNINNSSTPEQVIEFIRTFVARGKDFDDSINIAWYVYTYLYQKDSSSQPISQFSPQNPRSEFIYTNDVRKVLGIDPVRNPLNNLLNRDNE